jgi:hypothetical protein
VGVGKIADWMRGLLENMGLLSPKCTRWCVVCSRLEVQDRIAVLIGRPKVAKGK